jgi:type III secretory pathway component EscV
VEKWILNPNVKNLVLNISAGLISVPFVFISYEAVKHFTERKIRARINGYIKFHIEKSTFGILKYLYAWFFPTEKNPIIITSPIVRMYFKRLTEDYFKDLIVVSYNEVETNVELQSVGMVSA